MRGDRSVTSQLPASSADRWKTYRQFDWPAWLREFDSGTLAGRERSAQFEEYKAMAADRQARALLAATRVLAIATIGLLVATAVLAYITAIHKLSYSAPLPYRQALGSGG